MKTLTEFVLGYDTRSHSLTFDSTQQTADSRQQTADSRQQTKILNIKANHFGGRMFSKALLKLFILIMILIPSSLSSKQLFIKNVGQWDSDIMYAGSGEGYQIVIARSGIYINHQQVNKIEESIDDFGNKGKELLLSSDNMRLHFVGSQIEKHIIDNKVSGRISPITFDFWNYGPNSDWYWDVPCYEEILISDIYPDISMKLYYEGDNIRYDFELGTSANYNQIKMIVQGAESSEIIDNELIIKTKIGEIRNGKIRTFINSSGEELPTSIRMNNYGEISFDVAVENKLNEKITIDPLVYSSYLYNQTAIEPNYGAFNVLKRGNENWLTVWNYDKLILYTDTIDYSEIELSYPNMNNIIVYNSDFKQVKKYIIVSKIGSYKIIFPDEKHLLISLYIPKDKLAEYDITDLDIKWDLCLLKVNFTNKKIIKGIKIPSSDTPNIYLCGDSRILVSYNSSSKTYAYLTDNAYFLGCDSSFSKNCVYPYLVVLSSDFQEIEFATLVPYSTSNRFAASSNIVSDSKGNIYCLNRIPYDYVHKYENVIGNWTGTVPIRYRDHFNSIYKFDKNYNFIKTVAVGFAEVRHFFIDKKDELVLIGNIQQELLDEIWLHDECIMPAENDWTGRKMFEESKIGIMKLNTDLEYLRSGIIPGGYFIEFFNITTGWYYPNAGSDAALDEDNNILVTICLPNYHFDGFPNKGNESFKVGHTEYKEGINNDAALVKVSSDLTQILYSTVYGGSGDDAPGFMFVQDTLVTIVGTTGSTDLVVTPDADVPYPQYPTEKLFVVTLNTNSPVSVTDSPEKQYIYPNPASTYLELPEELVNRFSEFVITDLLGRSLVSHALQSNRIDISTLPTGTYNLALTNSTTRSSYLFVKTE